MQRYCFVNCGVLVLVHPGMTEVDLANTIAERMTPDLSEFIGANFTVVTQESKNELVVVDGLELSVSCFDAAGVSQRVVGIAGENILYTNK
jgi:hypothetical protein